MRFFGGLPRPKRRGLAKSLVARGPSPQRFRGFATMSLRGGMSANNGPFLLQYNASLGMVYARSRISFGASVHTPNSRFALSPRAKI